MSKTIFDTAFASNYGLALLAKLCANELQSSVKLDMEPDAYLTLVKGVTPIVRSPISEAFVTTRNEGLFSNLCFISTILDRKAALPEILTIDDITVYGKHVPAVKQDKFKGAWVNLSPMLSAPKERFGGPTVKGANELMAATVRALLCMAYDDSNGNWLSDKGAAFVIEVYARSMAAPISRVYSLDVEEAALVRYAFAYYMASMLTTSRDEQEAPTILHRCLNIFKQGKVDLEGLNERMFNVVGKATPSMEHVAQFVTDNGPTRMRGFTAANIYRMTQNASRNSTATYIAADYPPYLVYLLLRLASGDKHPIFTNVLNTHFTRQTVERELNDIIRDKGTFSGIRINE